MTVKRWIGAVVSVAFLSPISSALAADGFYVNVMAGVNFLQNADNTGGGITLTSDLNKQTAKDYGVLLDALGGFGATSARATTGTPAMNSTAVNTIAPITKAA